MSDYTTERPDKKQGYEKSEEAARLESEFMKFLKERVDGGEA